jgi:hypothetical protein
MHDSRRISCSSKSFPSHASGPHNILYAHFVALSAKSTLSPPINILDSADDTSHSEQLANTNWKIPNEQLSVTASNICDNTRTSPIFSAEQERLGHNGSRHGQSEGPEVRSVRAGWASEASYGMKHSTAPGQRHVYMGARKC